MIRKILIGAAALAVVALSACNSEAEENGLNDLQIAHIAYTAGTIDIRYAHLALAVSENADVRAFADTMLRDHVAVNDAALDLLEKLEAAPEDNETSQALLQQASDKRDELKVLSGEAFDRAYAQNELAYHQFVNKTVEETFIPAADNQEFKELLGVALATFKIHEGHAEQLVEKTK